MSLERTLGAVIELIAERLEARHVVIETSIPHDLPAYAADADQLQQVFLNLALNAADAMPGGGRLRIVARLGERVHPGHGPGSRPCLAVTFEDTGGGIAPERLERVFEPFFTTKEVGGGTGLGLAISWGIVREHGGWIDVTSTPGRGTLVTVCLPLEHPARRAGLPGSEAAA
jgi:signal transduction histidine kinase